jgi:hypothetical protein
VGRLAQRVDVIVCSTPVAEEVQRLIGSAAEVIVDDRALDNRAVEMLAAVLVRHDAAGTPPTPSARPRAARRELRRGGRQA